MVGDFGSFVDEPFDVPPCQFVELGPRVVFIVSSPELKASLWSTDGTPEGTRQLMGQLVSAPMAPIESIFPVVTIGDVLYLLRTQQLGSEGEALWRTDGTLPGTRRLTPEGVAPSLTFDDHEVFLVGSPLVGTLYFVARDERTDEDRLGLWRSEGTPESTFLVRELDLPEVAGTGVAGAMVERNGELFFTLRHPGEPGEPPRITLWTSDGTSTGTHLITIYAGDGVLAATASGVFFQARDERGDELWVTDGTAGGARRVTNFTPDQPFFEDGAPDLGSRFHRPFVADGQLLFAADDGIHGFELWTVDGPNLTPRRLTALPAATPFARISERRPLAVRSGRALVLAAATAEHGVELWRTDGTPASTRLVADLCPGPCDGVGSELFRVGERLFFTGTDNRFPARLWTVNPGGGRVRPALPPCTDCRVDAAALRDGRFFLLMEDPRSGEELWRFDPAANRLERLTDLPEPRALSRLLDVDRFGDRFAQLDGERIVFGAVNVSAGADLWRSDGRPETTEPVADLFRVIPGSDPGPFVGVGDKVLFGASDNSDPFSFGFRDVYVLSGSTPAVLGNGVPGFFDLCGDPGTFGTSLVVGGAAYFWCFLQNQQDASLWRTDGTDAGTTLLATFAIFSDTFPVLQLLPLGNQVLFPVVVVDLFGNRGLEIWSTDGTPAGTGPLVRLGDEGISFRGFHPTGNRYFVWTSGVGMGVQLWSSDGTAAGTEVVATLSGIAEILATVGGRTFFVNRLADRDELWVSDGTVDGTARVTAFPNRMIRHLTPLGGTVLMLLSRPAGAVSGAGPATVLGLEIWASAGTEQGTVRLAVVSEGAVQDGPVAPPVVVGNRMFFAARDETSGTELWATDGTAAGTRRVADLVPGEGSSFPHELVAASDRLFFAAFDPDHGVELWTSDGTPAGTRRVHDIHPGPASSQPRRLAVLGDRLFFSADDGLFGREPWSLPLSGPGGCQPTATTLCLAERFRVELALRDFEATQLPARSLPLTADTGTFWVFGPDNLELAVKVLDAAPVNGHAWVFASALSNLAYSLTVTDTDNGTTRRYENPMGRFGTVVDTAAFPSGAGGSARGEIRAVQRFEPGLVALPGPLERGETGPCTATAITLCLAEGRFAAEVEWRDRAGDLHPAEIRPVTGDTGAFWFFGPDNLEVFVKLVDGRPFNGHFWVFFATLTDLEVTLTVEDRTAGTRRSYVKPAGRSGSSADTGSF
jgi:ELWxxDGT repeat protein